MLRKGPSSHGASRVLGFTLIELMVVVAVVAILASIALPSYTESVRKGRRGQAKADLVEAAQIAERFRTINGTYVGVSALAGFPAASPKTGTSYYNIAVSDEGANTFTLTATPIAGGAQASDRCGVLTINAAGVKTHSAGNDAECQFGTVSDD